MCLPLLLFSVPKMMAVLPGLFRSSSCRRSTPMVTIPTTGIGASRAMLSSGRPRKAYCMR